MSRKIVQLGYGKMGKAVLDDLLKTAQFDELVVADGGPDFAADIARITDPRVKPVGLNVDDRKALRSLIQGAGVVVELLPIRFTMQVAQAAVAAGTHLVSSVFIIDWSVQDPEGARRQQEQMAEIDRQAREKGLTVLKEFGMDPGLDLVIAGETVRQLGGGGINKESNVPPPINGRRNLMSECAAAPDEVRALYTYGAGFPEHRLSKANPIGYKFTWSIVDAMYSYAIPGRILTNGKPHDIPADGMFTPGNYHILNLKEMGGPLECFVNGDGETLAGLFPAIARTATTLGRFICRWPGHAAFWEKMVQCGFNRAAPVKVNGAEVIPAAFCAALLGSQPQFHYGPGERDVALIRADARGMKGGRPTRVIGQLVDYRDLKSGYTAMQRTVAFPMSVGAQMILDGRLSKRGIIGPADVPFEPVAAELRKRGLRITQTTGAWDGSVEPGA